MFLHVSVILFTGWGLQGHTQGGGWGVWPGEGISNPTPGGGGVSQHAMRQTPPADGYYCGRHASYWNASLFDLFIYDVIYLETYKRIFSPSSTPSPPHPPTIITSFHFINGCFILFETFEIWVQSAIKDIVVTEDYLKATHVKSPVETRVAFSFVPCYFTLPRAY